VTSWVEHGNLGTPDEWREAKGFFPGFGLCMLAVVPTSMLKSAFQDFYVFNFQSETVEWHSRTPCRDDAFGRLGASAW
jgi:hypothetical protein